MAKTLGGVCFLRNAIKYDYNFIEAIESMLNICDKVIVVDAGSDSEEGTIECLKIMQTTHSNLQVIFMDAADWESISGKEKLAHFQNVASTQLQLQGIEYQILIQGDEILHENSYGAVREAIETGAEGIMCKRINLWGSPYTELNVPQNRMPCSPEVIRIAKTSYRSYGDGESLNAQANMTFIDKIRIYHMGFVRDKKIMVDKVKNMQINVFGMLDYDSKLDQCGDEFNPELWFSKDELKPISEPLPKLIQRWALARS